MMAAAVRAAGGRARRGRRMRRVLWFIMVSSGLGQGLGLVAGAQPGLAAVQGSWAAPFGMVRGAAALYSGA
jgi:hypothetical protein